MNAKDAPMLPSHDTLSCEEDMQALSRKNNFGLNEAKQIGESLGIRWDRFGVEQFRMGLNIERTHRPRESATDVMLDESLATGAVALAHLTELPDYYTQLAAMTCAPLHAFHTFRMLLL